MPIPALAAEEQRAERVTSLVLVPPESALARASGAALFVPRILAHALDFSVVGGCSVYVSKLFSVILLSFHARAIGGAGRMAAPLFRQAYDYSTMQLFAAGFAALSVVYFVAAPMVLGRTLGMGLFGLRIEGPNGARPTMRQLAYRLLGCTITYATAGMLCVVGLRERHGHFFHDQLSDTRITKE